METVKVHGGKLLILDLLMAEEVYTDNSALTDNKPKDLNNRADKQAENKFIASLFICMIDNGRYLYRAE